MSRRRFDAFEVSLGQDFSHPSGGVGFERVLTAYDWEDSAHVRTAGYYTLHGYRSWDPDNIGGGYRAPDGGTEEIAEFESFEVALDMAYALADGKPVEDCVPPSLRNINGISPKKLAN